MQLVERHIIVESQELANICARSKRLYNQTLYYLRQSLFGNIEKFSEYELTGLMAQHDHEDYRQLPAQTSQQVIKQCFNGWKNYFTAIEKWKNNKSGFSGIPKLPKYKKEQFAVYFTNQQAKLKNGYIHFPKNTISSIKTSVNNICQVRIIPQANCHIIEVVYEKEASNLNLNKQSVLSLDIGLSNLATSANNVGLPPFIINGNPIKAFNQWYNKKKAFLRSSLKGNVKTSKRSARLTHYRNCWVDDKLHKISRFIVNFCTENNIGTIVVGKNNGWKNRINLGKKNNQGFTNMPIARLIDKLSYKAILAGINLICTEESYTSKCDALALESIQWHKEYNGRRIKRGLFQSGTGKLINADGNGAINIARKVIGDGFVRSLLDSCAALAHYKINVL